MLRAPSARVLVALIAGLLLAAGLQAPAEAATKRSISLSISPTIVVINSPTTFSGRLSKSPKGSLVAVQRKSGSRWVTVKRTRTTTSSGGYRVVVTAPGKLGTFSYRVVAPAKGKLKRATSSTRKLRTLYRTTVNMTVSPGTIPAAQYVTVKGSVRPIFPYSQVSIQKYADGRWSPYYDATVLPNGTFSKRVLIGGTTRLRAVAPALGKFASGASPERIVKSTPAVETLSLPIVTRTVPYAAQLTTVYPSAGTWTVTGLPLGLTVNASTGVISGTTSATATTYSDVRISFVEAGSPPLAAAPRTVALVLDEAPAEIVTAPVLPPAVVGTFYSKKLESRGNVAGTWTTTALPAGLNLDPSTGVISGTPTVSATTNVTSGYKQTSTGDVAPNKPLVLKVLPGVSQTSVAQGTVGSQYSVDLNAVGDNQTGTWTAAPLPDGLELDKTTGALTGTPTAAGTSQVAVTFTQTTGGLTSPTMTLPLRVKPVITTDSLPVGTRTLPYPSTQLTAQGSSAGTWSADNLPDGLSITSAGVISGTPTTVQTENVTLRFTETANGGAPEVSRVVSLKINQAANPTITTDSLTAGTVGTPYPGTTLVATGPGNPAGTWTASPLPAGLALNENTGAITGTPAVSGTTAVVIGFTQASTGLTATKTRNLLVNAVISTSSLPDGTRTLAYPSTQVTAVGSPAGTWSADNLPDGLTISSGGVISGTPTAVGTRSVTLRFTQSANGGAPQVTKTLDLEIVQVAAPTISTGATLTPGTVSTAYSVTLAATGPGPDNGTWDATTALPDGLDLSAGGVLSGTPTAAGSTQFTVVFTQTSTGRTATKQFTLAVKPDITTTSLPGGTVNAGYSHTLTAVGGSGTWTASPLPAGLELNPATGEIYGVPTTAGQTSVTIGFTSHGQVAATETFTLEIGE